MRIPFDRRRIDFVRFGQCFRRIVARHIHRFRQCAVAVHQQFCIGRGVTAALERRLTLHLRPIVFGRQAGVLIRIRVKAWRPDVFDVARQQESLLHVQIGEECRCDDRH